MSSSIPIRRTTRVTRATKDNENANAKPSRIMTRSKTQASSTLVENARVSATTASSRAKTVETEKTAGKRKREILGEVTESNGGKAKSSSLKGKEKAGSGTDKAGSSLLLGKGKTAITRTARAPLREVGGSAAAQKVPRSKPVAGDRLALKPIREDGDRHYDEIIVDEPQPTNEPGEAATFNLVPQTLEHPPVPYRHRTTDSLDGEPVFKKRITEDEEGRQPVARPTPGHPTISDDSQLDEDMIATELVEVNEVEEEEEEEEEPILWDDLDAEDAEDPLMASEYVHEIMAYMKELEIRTAPTPDYMQNHSQLDWEKRGILIDWILQIHGRYNFLSESFFLFVNIMDRFLSLRPTVALHKLQLVGVSCFCAAVKFEEGVAPSTAELVLLTGEQYTTEEICKAEKYVLKTINYDLSYPGPMSWLRRGSKADDLDPNARTIAKYLLELATFSPSLVATPSSLVAATTLWFARLVLERVDWTHNLVHYTTYKEHEIVPVAEVLLNAILSPSQSETLYKKYASKRFIKCSVFVRKWALARFHPGSEVDLASELPMLKMEIAEIRAAKIAARQEEYL